MDSTQLTIVADVPLRSALPSILINIGVLVDSVRPLRDAPSLDGVWLHEGTSANQAAIAAGTIRQYAGVRFVSNVYLYGTGQTVCPLRLLNSLDVKFKTTTTPAQAGALQQRTGLTVQQEPTLGGATRLRYPAGSQHTPLEIVAALYRHPYVDWAAADMMGCTGPNF